MRRLHSLLLSIECTLLLMGQFGRISIRGAGSFYALEVVMAIHTVIAVGSVMYQRKRAIKAVLQDMLARPTSRLALWWLGFVTTVWLLTTPYSPPRDNLVAFLYIFRIAALGAYAYFVMPQITKAQALSCIRILALLVPFIAILQYTLLPDLRFLAAYGWDPHMYRAVGTIFDPPLIGSLFGMLLMWSIVHMSARQSRGEWWRTWSTMIVLYVATIFLFSRSTYLAVLFSVLAFLIKRKKWALSAVWVILFALSVVIAPLTIPSYSTLESAKIIRTSTVSSRSIEIKNGLIAFINHPVWGIGYNRVLTYKNTIHNRESAKNPQRNVQTMTKENTKVNGNDSLVRPDGLNQQSHAASAFHSYWVTQIATTGLIGMSILVAFFLYLIKKTPIFGYILYIPAFIGLFDNTLFHPFVILTLTYILRSFDYRKESK